MATETITAHNNQRELEVMQAKLEELTRKYSNALDQISLHRDNLEQDAALFGAVYDRLKSHFQASDEARLFLGDALSLVGLGHREALGWQEAAERFLKEAEEA